ncbi:MAG: adenine phosphoribosyltransferase, partial [Candidatus Dadabacteria bacterium]|nr:adenine phosphoribosyltransferase [Candidatus Dadabacteria bacterium]
FVAPESRGFIFASALSYKLGKELILVSKPGKLPSDTASVSYDLEYGKDVLEIHKDAINDKSSVVIVDDLLATGGTAHSTGRLVEELGGSVAGYLFLVELMGLKGAEALSPHPVWSLLKMPG